MLSEKSIASTFRITLAVSILLHLVTSYFSIGYNHGDEHYQIFEFAGLKLGFNQPQELAWEYPTAMRPALQPAIVYAFVPFMDSLSINDPFTQAFIFRLLSSALALFSTYVFVKAFMDELSSDNLKKAFIVMSFLAWIILFNDVRFSSEGWSASFITLGVGHLKLFYDKKNPMRTPLYLLATGCIIGFAFVCRFQTGFFIVGLGAWMLFIKKDTLLTISWVALGILISISLGVLIDSWFYGKFTLSAVNYFTQNILENKASNYGVSPWWYYGVVILEKGYFLFGGACLVSFVLLLYKKPSSLFVWSILPFVIIHSLVGHKEARFLLPIVKFTPFLIVYAFTLIPSLTAFSSKIFSAWGIAVLVFINSLLSIPIILLPADYQIGVVNYIEKHYDQPVSLFYQQTNPYESYGLFNHFYNRRSVAWEKADSPKVLKYDSLSTCLYVTTNKEEVSQNQNGFVFKKLYQPIPDYPLIDFNGWTKRHTQPILYSFEPKK